MKYYDFVSYGWCHIRERPARLVSYAFLYTTCVIGCFSSFCLITKFCAKSFSQVYSSHQFHGQINWKTSRSVRFDVEVWFRNSKLIEILVETAGVTFLS